VNRAGLPPEDGCRSCVHSCSSDTSWKMESSAMLRRPRAIVEAHPELRFRTGLYARSARPASGAGHVAGSAVR
jgi:hypothetical protein